VTRLAKLLLVAALIVGVGPAAAHRPIRAFPRERHISANFVVAMKQNRGSIDKLLASLDVKPRFRFESRALGGFAAKLTFRQTQRLLQDPNVDCVCSDNWSWIVDYAPVVAYPDVAQRTSELVAKYGFTTTHRGDHWFSAQLSAAQLHGLTTEPDIQGIEPVRNLSWAGFQPHGTPGAPQAKWKALGYSYYTNEHHPANRIYYARRLDQTARWMSHLRARDQYALKHLNFSRYGALAIFTAPRVPFEVQAVLLVKDGLTAQIRRSDIGFPVPQYALIRIRKGSLPTPVKRLYISEGP
jgi:hypothetical protein